MIAFRLVSGVKDHFVSRFPDWWGTAYLAGFGYTLYFDTPFASNHAYDTMAWFAPEDTWGLVICLVAVARCLGLIINGLTANTARYTPIVRVLAAALSSFVWWVVALSFYAQNTHGTAWRVYATIASSEMVLSWLAARSAGRAWGKNAGP